MPIHHLLSRSALLMMALWAGGGFLLLSHCGFHWERQLEGRVKRAASHVAEVLFAPAARNQRGAPGVPTWENRSDAFESDRSEIRRRQAKPLRHRARSASVIRFDYAPATGLVSVVIPTYNRANIIGRAIESALDQTYRGVEVIVADDGSSDNTRAVADAYGPRVTYVCQANSGVSAARNLGMRQTRGEFIAFLDSDDSWRPWKIEAQMTALSRHPKAGLVWTDMAAVDETDRVLDAGHLRVMYSAYEKVDINKTLGQVDTLGALSSSVPRELAAAPVREGDIFEAILLGNLIHTSTVLFRRSWCEQTGGFDESYARAGEDYEFYIRLSSAGPVVLIDAPSTLYRIGSGDQLTRPQMMLEIARNNLRAVESWIPRSASWLTLPPQTIRARFAESFAWVGEAELDAGHRLMAARRLSESLAVMPGLDRRALLLARCALPAKVVGRLRSMRQSTLQVGSRHSGERSPT